MACCELLQFVLFNDDTNLFYCDKSCQQLEKTVNRELELLSNWFKANKLSLNLDKTNFIMFRSTNKQIPKVSVTINSCCVCQFSHTKFLGVYLDEQLK